MPTQRAESCGTSTPLPRVTYHLNRLHAIDEPVDYWPSGWVRTVTASRGAGYADLRFTG